MLRGQNKTIDSTQKFRMNKKSMNHVTHQSQERILELLLLPLLALIGLERLHDLGPSMRGLSPFLGPLLDPLLIRRLWLS